MRNRQGNIRDFKNEKKKKGGPGSIIRSVVIEIPVIYLISFKPVNPGNYYNLF